MSETNFRKICPRAEDITGKTFGEWTIVSFHSKNKGRAIRWNCRCSCGSMRILMAGNFLSGKSTRCRTCSSAIRGLRERGPAYDFPREERVWTAMKQRCLNTDDHAFSRYGGRGIIICDRWLESFSNFIEDMGPRPSAKHSLDRIDNGGGYAKDNCRWATIAIQHRNTRVNHWITHDDRTMCMADWAKELGVSSGVIHGRLRIGWSIQRALTTPVKRHKSVT